jgi:serine/threonine-protein kinase RsbW
MRMAVPNLRVRMPGRPENVAVIREILSGLVEPLGVVRPGLDDIKTAVSEAANNVVVHAYRDPRGEGLDGEGEGTGPLELDATIAPKLLTIVVRDEGRGIGERPPRQEGSIQNVGLSIIEALSDRLELRAGPRGGTEVLMEFGLHEEIDPALYGGPLAALDGAGPPGELVVSIAPAGLAKGVLGRLTAALCVLAELSIDRLADAQLISDALAAGATRVDDEAHLNAGFLTSPRRLELRVGPLPRGRAEEIVRASELPGLGTVLGKLADELRIEPLEGAETLHLTILERAP